MFSDDIRDVFRDIVNWRCFHDFAMFRDMFATSSDVSRHRQKSEKKNVENKRCCELKTFRDVS